MGLAYLPTILQSKLTIHAGKHTIHGYYGKAPESRTPLKIKTLNPKSWRWMEMIFLFQLGDFHVNRVDFPGCKYR